MLYQIVSPASELVLPARVGAACQHCQFESTLVSQQPSDLYANDRGNRCRRQLTMISKCADFKIRSIGGFG